MKEDVVISGISCRLPESDNMVEFRDNLMKGVDMVTEDARRWEPGYLGLPRRNGKLKELSHFDASFFGVNPKQANRMDPQLRLLLEVAYESIVDAGVNPEDLRGSRTGVFVGGAAVESSVAWGRDSEKVEGYTMTGCQSAMLANRLSFYFDFKGPSIVIDTACSASLLAVDQALTAINNGQCDAAVVAGVSLCLRPATSATFMRLGMLSPDGACKSFDSSANGYCRSEAIVAVLLVRGGDAKRIYATLINAGNNSDGHTQRGITFPSGEAQNELLRSVYEEAGLDPTTVAYVEAHGTGTQAGDPQEVNAIANMFCNGRMDSPLLLGSVKSNIGHSETASGHAALAKVIIAMEEGIIPGNLHFENPNPGIPALIDGRVSVVSKNTPWVGGIVGINSFGFGGTNVHVAMKSNTNEPKEPHAASELPRLFVYSGRTEEGVNSVIEAMKSNSKDVELQSLLAASAYNPSNQYRGYTILNVADDIKFIKKSPPENRPLWYVFSGMGSQWFGMARDMMTFNVFYQSIMASCRVLKPFGLDLYDILMNGNETDIEDTITSFVSIAAIQIGLVDMLKELGMTPDGMLGHSVGEIACGYADGGLTAEQTILAAYWRGKCIMDARLPPGAMAAVGLSWDEATTQCPPGVVPACHNTKNIVTVSGPHAKVQRFVSELKTQGIFAKEVRSAGNAFHSYFMADVASVLKERLDQFIPGDKPRSNRWISSSIPADRWGSNLARFSSSDYYVNNLVCPVLFQEALSHVPENAIVIEIAPHALLQSVLKRSLSQTTECIGLMNRENLDNVQVFLNAVGRCFSAGVNVHPLKLYPDVTYPVSKGTTMISPLIKWDHTHSWDVPTFDDFENHSTGTTHVVEIDMAEESYFKDHVIDGRAIFPAVGYSVITWKTLAKLKGVHFEDMAVAFENIAFQRATFLPDEGLVRFEISIMPKSGYFEINEGGSVVVTGTVTSYDAQDESVCHLDVDDPNCTLALKDIYKYLKIRGYGHRDTFRCINDSSYDGTSGHLLWTGNWVTYLDGLVQAFTIVESGETLKLPVSVKAFRINPMKHRMFVNSLKNSSVVPFHVNRASDKYYSAGCEVVGICSRTVSKRPIDLTPIVGELCYVPYDEDDMYPPDNNLKQFLNHVTQFVVDSTRRVLETRKDLSNRHILEAIIANNSRNHSSSAVLANASVLLELFSRLFHSLLTKKTSLQNIINDLPLELLKVDNVLNYLSVRPALKTCLDLVLENCSANEYLDVLEVNGGVHPNLFPYAVPIFCKQIRMEKLRYSLTNDSVWYSHSEQDLSGINQIDWSFMHETATDALRGKSDLIILSDPSKRGKLSASLKKATELIRPGGFLLLHELATNSPIGTALGYIQSAGAESSQDIGTLSDENFYAAFKENNLELIATKSDGLLSTLFLCRYSSVIFDEDFTVVNVDGTGLEWVDDIKKHIATDKISRLWLVSTGRPHSGIVGLVKCLRLEPRGHKVRCVFMADEDQSLTPLEWQYLRRRDLAINVFKNKKWGSYRIVPLDREETHIPIEYASLKLVSPGDLTSFRWIESPINCRYGTTADDVVCTVCYAALNFRDVMLASAKLHPSAVPGNTNSVSFPLGIEMAGTTADGQRLMAVIMYQQSFATTLVVDKRFTWTIPNHWSMEEAATVPLVYSTAYYALVVRGRVQKEMRVLVHSGCGGVGQAVITLALHYGCDVYTTVSSAEKREYLMARFPQIGERHIANSRDMSFEDDLLEATNGAGFDIIINSLSGKKFEATLRMIAKHGHFVEIGKVDMFKNSSLGMSIFKKNVTFHGLLLDELFDNGNKEWMMVHSLMADGLANGVIKPLNRIVFERDRVEEAFRYMLQGKHIGKVVLKIKDVDIPEKIDALPDINCDPNKNYIITGGLGGFGLELAQWLIDRGAQKLVLTSRVGVQTGFQKLRIARWTEAGVHIQVSICDMSSMECTERLVVCAQHVGPVGGVFHLAGVLKDGLIGDLSSNDFAYVTAPKLTAIQYLDDVTRRYCVTSLDWFVAFSSFVASSGNVGQTNYAFANSAMERVCESRANDGFHALAVQWGAIAEVGMVADDWGDEHVVGGTLPQKLASCFKELNNFMCHSQTVVTSYVLPSSALMADNTTSGDTGAKVARILGVSDPNDLDHDTSLGDLGIDSMMAVEVVNVIERDLGMAINIDDMRELTLNDIARMANTFE